LKHITISIILIISLSACRTVKPIINNIQHDSIVYVNKYLHDSINVYKHDSVNIRQSNDTIFKDSYHTLIKYNDRVVKDSTNNKQYYNITKTIEVNRLTKIQKILMYVGLLSIVCGVGAIFLKIRKII